MSSRGFVDRIYQVDERGIHSVEYDQAEHVQLTRDFLNDRDRFLKRLLSRKPSATPES